MLHITIPSSEQWDAAQQEFVYTETKHIKLEHSLVSLSKWESKWCKPFLSKHDKTIEETMDYVRCMVVGDDSNDFDFNNLTMDNVANINAYIENPMTATYFPNVSSKKVNREPTTAEMIYYWMIAHNIPFECQEWHLNRLLALIQLCSIKSQPPKKRSRSEILSSNAALNNARREKLNTKG